jgi:hypothetical protein
MSGMVGTLVEPALADVREDAETAGAEDLRRTIHKAILARRFVAVHKHAARQCLRAARAAAHRGDRDLAARLLGDAREEHAQAQSCTRVARAFEGQAEDMGKAAGGVYRATGRASPSAAIVDIPAIGAHSASASTAPMAACSPAMRRTLGGSE